MTEKQKKFLLDAITSTAAHVPDIHASGPGDLYKKGWAQAVATLVGKLQPLLDAPHNVEEHHEPPKRTPPHSR